MHRDMTCLIAKVHDAAFAAEAWPETLRSLTDALDVASAACIIRNKITGVVDWVCFSGLSAEFEADYITHYAPMDALSPLLNVSTGWMMLSECLPASFLR